MIAQCTAKNGGISPCSLCWKFWGKGHFPKFPKREMEISVSLQFPRENWPFPLNFHAKLLEIFRYFLLWWCRGAFHSQRSHSPLAKILLFSRKIHQNSVKFLLI